MTRAMMALYCLLLASPALAQTPGLKETDVSGQPTGEGDPDATVCRRPMPIPTKRLLGPRVCKTNALWAQYREKGMMVSADGTGEEPATSTFACHTQGGVGTRGNTSMARIMSHMSCE